MEHDEPGHQGPHRGGLLPLAIGALGIVYGDIGTSPLYAFREAFEGHGLDVSDDGVIGACSLTFWALIVVISIKYILLVMRADNHGEGGILALTSLLPRDVGRLSVVLVAFGLFGTAMLYGDGMITPAISVLSAVEGLRIATTSMDRFVLPIAVAILAGLFLIQRRGTGGIGRIFGPIMFAWFLVIGLLGAVQIALNPAILEALSPHHAITFFTEYRLRGFWALGSIFLVVTGGEALYADMGHFGRRPINVGWFSLVLPALALNYLGQGALLLREPDAIVSPFFNMAPGWAIWPLVLLATLATVIASQALISGAFSLTTQAMQADYLPRILVCHTSASQVGQVYVPFVNWILMVSSIGLVIGFRTSSHLAAAYGIAVTLTMAITTQLFMAVATYRWQWSRLRTLLVGVPLLVIDLAFVSAQLIKIPHGGWFALGVGIAQFTLMTTWRTGRKNVFQELRRGETPVADFVASLPARALTRVSGTAAFLSKDPQGTPPALLENVLHNKVLHDRVLLLSVATADVARIPARDRVSCVKVGPGMFQITLTFGYMEDPDVPATLAGLDVEGPIDPADVTYFLGRETVVSTEKATMPRWQERLFVLQTRTAASAARFFRLPSKQVFEVGTTVEL